jgi:hypothetical protein
MAPAGSGNSTKQIHFGYERGLCHLLRNPRYKLIHALRLDPSQPPNLLRFYGSLR